MAPKRRSGLRWSRQDSVAVIGPGPQRSSIAESSTAGAASYGCKRGPGSIIRRIEP